MTNKDEQDYQKANKCHICDKNILLRISEIETIVILTVSGDSYFIWLYNKYNISK